MPQFNPYNEKSTGYEDDSGSWADSSLPHSLTLMPAGLEVVSSKLPNIKAPGSDKELSPVDIRGDKQVYSPTQASVVSEKEAVRSSNDATDIEKEAIELHPDESAAPSGSGKKHRVICGMRAKVFWISLALMIVVFLVGIGLGMGLHDWKSDDGNDVAASSSTVESSTLSTLGPSSTAIERHRVA